MIGDCDFFVNVILKFGIMIELVIVFCVFKELLINKYGKEEVNKCIYVIIDCVKGVVKVEVDVEGWEIFVIFDDVGGCFIVLMLVGFLLIVVSGVDIDCLMEGVNDVCKEYGVMSDLKEN